MIRFMLTCAIVESEILVGSNLGHFVFVCNLQDTLPFLIGLGKLALPLEVLEYKPAVLPSWSTAGSIMTGGDCSGCGRLRINLPYCLRVDRRLSMKQSPWAITEPYLVCRFWPRFCMSLYQVPAVVCGTIVVVSLFL